MRLEPRPQLLAVVGEEQEPQRAPHRGARSVRLCALLDKKEAREVEVPIDYCGFRIGKEFVVGYGLDFNERYRNLPYIGVVEMNAK